MVPGGGLEPPTFGLWVRRSNRLSYPGKEVANYELHLSLRQRKQMIPTNFRFELYPLIDWLKINIKTFYFENW